MITLTFENKNNPFDSFNYILDRIMLNFVYFLAKIKFNFMIHFAKNSILSLEKEINCFTNDIIHLQEKIENNTIDLELLRNSQATFEKIATKNEKVLELLENMRNENLPEIETLYNAVLKFDNELSFLQARI